MKTLWKGAIRFGLVNIPVKMYTAAQSRSIDLTMLHKKDLGPIKYQRVCESDGKEVPWDEIVKGYKNENGEYIILTDEDFENANVEKSHTIDIQHFIDTKDVDSIYFEKPYYLEPDKSAVEPYALLKEAIKKSNKVGIAKYVLKNREHIGLVMLFKDIIILNQLRFQEEIRSFEELDIPTAKKISPKEIDMASALINQLTDKFNPKEYKDTYNAELKKIIEQKSKGRRIKPKGKPPKPTETKNLMTLLKASLKGKAA